jgi:hypothetical protein
MGIEHPHADILRESQVQRPQGLRRLRTDRCDDPGELITERSAIIARHRLSPLTPFTEHAHQGQRVQARGRPGKDDRSTLNTELLVRRLILRDAGRSVFPVAGFAGNAFCFAFTGNLLIQLIDDALELISPTQRVFLFGFRHIPSP